METNTLYELCYYENALSAEILGYADAYVQEFINIEPITINDNYFIGYKIVVSSGSDIGMQLFLRDIKAFQTSETKFETAQ